MSVIVASMPLLGLVNLCVIVFLIPYFAGIFQDMIGNRPLPAFTSVVIHSRWVLAGFDCVCMLVTLFGVQQRMSPRYVYALLAILFTQVIFTLIALFLPLNEIMRSLSSGH